MPTVTATVSVAGGNLSPTAPGLSSAAAGGNLSPTAPGGSGAAAGGNLSPTAPGLSSSAAGGNLSPTAPGLSGAVAGGNLSPTAPELIQLSGAATGPPLTVTGGTLVAYGMVGDTLVEAGTTVTESMGVMAWSTDGNKTAAATGDWLFLHWVSVDAWYWEWWVDGEIYAKWIATDGSSTFPNSAPDEIPAWTPLGSTAATGTFSLMFDNNLLAESKMTEAAGDLLPAAPGRSTAVAGGNLSPSAPGAIVA